MTERPKLAALAVVIRADHVLLVQRRNEPDAGLWGFPGGHVDFGETALDAAARELKEETRVLGRPLRYLTNVDVIDLSDDGSVRFHFLLAAVLCDYISGDPVARDDADDARWWAVADVLAGRVRCSTHVDSVVQIAVAGGDD
ncbi:MAG: NUDIX hydrolase [Pseudomonadota bacterium]